MDEQLRGLVREIGEGDFTAVTRLQMELERRGILSPNITVAEPRSFIEELQRDRAPRRGRGLIIFLDDEELQARARNLQGRLADISGRIFEYHSYAEMPQFLDANLVYYIASIIDEVEDKFYRDIRILAAGLNVHFDQTFVKMILDAWPKKDQRLELMEKIKALRQSENRDPLDEYLLVMDRLALVMESVLNRFARRNGLTRIGEERNAA